MLSGQAPKSDEFELSLFGGGVGECVVLHLGDGAWLVVDSCLNRPSPRPVALEYLENLGVPPDKAIRWLAVTHWHADHTRGAAQIAEAAPGAQVILSGALTTGDFVDALGGCLRPSGGATRLREFARVLDSRRRGSARPTFAVTWALQDTTIAAGNPLIVALSPVSRSFTAAMLGIADLVPKAGGEPLGVPKVSPNEVSMALWVEAGGIRALLGADLERGQRGWAAVVKSQGRPRGKAHVVKVPHHGSAGAHEPGVWQQMLQSQPHTVLAPYSPSRLPGTQDITRLQNLSTSRWWTAGPGARKSGTRPRVVERVTSEHRVRAVEGKPGQVRLRCPFNSLSFSVDVCPPAAAF